MRRKATTSGRVTKTEPRLAQTYVPLGRAQAMESLYTLPVRTGLLSGATISSSPEIVMTTRTSTDSDFRAFAASLLAESASLFHSPAARDGHPHQTHAPSMWKNLKITRALLGTAAATHASSDISRLVGGPEDPGGTNRDVRSWLRCPE